MRNIMILSMMVVSLLAGCTSGDSRQESSFGAEKTPANTADLTWSEARQRKAMLSKVRYEVSVRVGDQEKEFSGQAKIFFDLSARRGPLRLDFYEGQIKSLKLNGQIVPPQAKKPFWIELPESMLVIGSNQVEVDYIQNYSTRGQGLHRFVDPLTKEVFLYTQFQTFDANRFMPCFDQPDLRASWQLTVEAPSSWVVSTTTMETKKTAIEAGFTRWAFEPSLELPTYLYSLHAGPYKVWTDKYQDIPLRIFARPSMADYVPVKEWFEITKQGLEFFNDYFAYPYPFKKYDQLFVPEFNAGAMENVGAVTFTENYLPRGTPTREQRKGAFETLLHEMAHMWFGNIVTMAWWNDLWLNESFATYMANLSLVEATSYKDGWMDFYQGAKLWAYWEDGLRTTHPIEAEVPSVKVAFANFDGITYGKGASVLKQLRAYVGPNEFRKGLRNYIKKHAFQNTELKDFIAALQAETKKDLTAWAKVWLQQTGADLIAAEWACEGERLKTVRLSVTPSAGAQFRPQTVAVSLYKLKAQGLKREIERTEILPFDLVTPKTTVSGDWVCPDLVYPNANDLAYAHVQLDARSLEFLKANLSDLPQDLERLMVWEDVWQMVRRGEMPIASYAALVETHFGRETHPLILGEIFSNLDGGGSVHSLMSYWPNTPDRKPARDAFVRKMEGLFLLKLNGAPSGSDLQKFWFDAYVGFAQTSLGLSRLENWAQARAVPSGLVLDSDRQWRVIQQLQRHRSPLSQKLFEDMKKKDSSDRGVRAALSSEAVRPDLAVKQKWVNALTAPKAELNYSEVRAVARTLFPFEQRNFLETFEKDFYEYLNQKGASEEDEIFVETLAPRISPLRCEPGVSSRLKVYLDSRNQLFPSVKKGLLMALDEDERCQLVRAKN